MLGFDLIKFYIRLYFELSFNKFNPPPSIILFMADT
ncbi:MAG: hypothetical protein RL757_1585 [Bacteroidota bacterium]|jgi:hypothetical protein